MLLEGLLSPCVLKSAGSVVAVGCRRSSNAPAAILSISVRCERKEGR